MVDIIRDFKLYCLGVTDDPTRFQKLSSRETEELLSWGKSEGVLPAVYSVMALSNTPPKVLVGYFDPGVKVRR